MPKDITNVYVPVKTPDYKVMAVLAAVLVHIGVVGFILYTNHPKPLNEPPMQMSLVTPEQLAMIQGQAAANQQAQAAANATVNNSTPTANPTLASVNNDLAARQAKWQRDQAAYAAQLDKQAMQDQQNFNNQIKQVQMNQTAELNKLKTIQTNPETNQPSTSTPPPASKATKNSSAINWKADGSGKETGETSNTSPAGGGATQGKPSGMSRASYKKTVEEKVYSNWRPPTNTTTGLKVVATFSISSTGEISNVSAQTNNVALKASLEQAILASSPLPYPPTNTGVNYDNNSFEFTVR